MHSDLPCHGIFVYSPTATAQSTAGKDPAGRPRHAGRVAQARPRARPRCAQVENDVGRGPRASSTSAAELSHGVLLPRTAGEGNMWRGVGSRRGGIALCAGKVVTGEVEHVGRLLDECGRDKIVEDALDLRVLL